MPIYMKYGDKIKGEVKGAYPGWVELTSAQFGVNRNVTTPRGNNSREGRAPSMTEVVVTKEQDSTSPLFFQEALRGEGVEVVIDFVKTDLTERYLRMTLKNCLVTSYQTSGHGGDSNTRPIESMSLNCESISYDTTSHPAGA